MGNLWLIYGYPLVNMQNAIEHGHRKLIYLLSHWLSIVMLGLPEGTSVGWSSYTRVDSLVYRDCRIMERTSNMSSVLELRSSGAKELWVSI